MWSIVESEVAGRCEADRCEWTKRARTCQHLRARGNGVMTDAAELEPLHLCHWREEEDVHTMELRAQGRMKCMR